MTSGSSDALKKCRMPALKDVSYDVTVVLTLYKRPEVLQQQLEKIMRQSLKPQEIIIYQDGTQDVIECPASIREQVTFIKSFNNMGVWGRFAVAQLAKSKYVCLFDDDTLPGDRWLENCHTEMQKRKGLYGGIGIIFRKANRFPYNEYFRLGWSNTVKRTTEVDFVGHSWFLETNWLPYLFIDSQEFYKMKYVAEDIYLSFMLRKKLGLQTYVPPHPKDAFQLYSSDPKSGWKLGLQDVAISANKAHLALMNQAVHRILKRGFRPLKSRNILAYLIAKKRYEKSHKNTSD
jgi:glycosyltransferase involved in cell wall biosynthesis